MNMHLGKTLGVILSFDFILLCCCSCTKMNDYHDKYLRNGEKIYARKVDSVRSVGGDGRLALHIFNSGNQVDRFLCFWDGKADSISISVADVSQKDGVYILLIGDEQNRLQEKSYVFQLYTIDGSGNRSVATEVIGEVYGDKYKQSLNNRIFKEATYDSEQAILRFEWGLSLNADEVGVQFYYYDASGKLDSIRMDHTDNLIELDDFSIGKPFYYQTMYKPNLSSLDTFYSPKDTVRLEFSNE